MTATAFVFGATGYTGREVVRTLASTETSVVAHIRPDSSRRAEWTQLFESWGAQVDTTAWEMEALTAALKRHQADVVYCLIGTTRKRKHQSATPAQETYEAVDYGLTALLVEACQRITEKPPRFVYVSSVGCRDGTPSAYMQARWKAEECIRHSGLPHVIARPSFISGPDRGESRPLERAASVAMDGLLAGLGALGMRRLARRYRSTDGRRLAMALIRWAASSDLHLTIESEDLYEDPASP